jgi:hypothetical protein
MEQDLKTWLVKILLPSLVAISIKLAVQAKKGISWFNVITSFVTGVGSAYLFSGVVISTVAEEYVPIAIAIIAISGEKIGLWLVYKVNAESLIIGILEKLKK